MGRTRAHNTRQSEEKYAALTANCYERHITEPTISTKRSLKAVKFTPANTIFQTKSLPSSRQRDDVNKTHRSKMTSENSETRNCPEYFGESYKTPTPSSPGTCVTNTLSCISDDQCILYGDYEMEQCRGLPQLTLALIKPDGMQFLDQIQKRIKNEGFDIVQERRIQLSPEQASNFYYEHYGNPYFPLLVTTMCEGPIQVYVLRRKDAVTIWRQICGPACVNRAKKVWPESLRAIYGTPDATVKNVCHSSANEEKAREEIRFFFPSMILDQNIQNELEVEDYIKEWVNPTLLEGLTQLCKNKPLDPITWLSTWLLKNNPYKPKMKDNVALTPT